MFVKRDRRFADRRNPDNDPNTVFNDKGVCNRQQDRRKIIYEEGYDYFQNGSKVTEFIHSGFPTLVSTKYHPIIKRRSDEIHNRLV